MKEATGELNMTVIIVIAVAALAAFFYTIIWPLIGNNIKSNSDCNKAICTCAKNNNKCEIAKCYTVDKNGNKNSGYFECPWKG